MTATYTIGYFTFQADFKAARAAADAAEGTAEYPELLAKAWDAKALIYGPDMASSAKLCRQTAQDIRDRHGIA
jgi:hypothetical protein